MTMLRKMLAALAAGAMVLVQLPMMASADEATELRKAPPAAENRPDFSYMGAVGTLTAEQTLMVANAIYDAVAAGASYAAYDTVNVAPIPYTAESKDAVYKIFKTIRYTYREALVYNSNAEFDYMPSSQCMTGLFLHFLFLDEGDGCRGEYDRICGLFDTLEAEADPNWSAPEKALYYHERLAAYYAYDSDEEGLCYTAYGLLTNGYSVCEGFAWTYNVLMNEMGIPSYVVTSKIDNDHSWNLLKIDNEYYHVDVTWDMTKAGDYYGRIWHESFLRCSPDMVSSGHVNNSNDWVTTLGENAYDMAARSFRFNDAFWVNSYTRIFPYNGGWMVKPRGREAEFQYYTVNRETLEENYVQTIAKESSKWDNYSDNESTFFVENNVLYHATPNGMMAVVHRDGGNEWDYVWVWLFSLSPEEQGEGTIYGMRIVGDEMQYMLSRGPKKRQFTVHTADMTAFRAMIAEQAGGVQPTTEEPTTEAPTEPTTEAPTTEAPTEPTTEAPTTEAPTEPTTEAPTTEAPTEPTTEVKTGDLSGDDSIDVVDIVVMTKFLAGAQPIETVEAKKAADIVEDGVLDVYDLAMLKWMVLNQ